MEGEALFPTHQGRCQGLMGNDDGAGGWRQGIGWRVLGERMLMQAAGTNNSDHPFPHL